MTPRKARKPLYLSSTSITSVMNDGSEVNPDLSGSCVWGSQDENISNEEFFNINNKISLYLLQKILQRFLVKSFSQQVNRLTKYPTNKPIKYRTKYPTKYLSN